MTGMSTPGASPETQEAGSIPRQNLLELLDDVSERRVFDSLHNEASLLRELTDNPNKLTSGIRTEMRRKLIASPESYENFSIKDIENTDAISDKTILEKLSILLLETSTGHKKLTNKVLSLFSQDTFKIDIPKGAENMRKLDVWIKGKNMKDIARYLRSPVLLRKHLQRECFGDDVNCFLSMHSMQFLKDLGIQESNLSTPEKAACNALWNGSQTFKQNSAGITETHHIRQYLGIINRSPKSRTEKLKVQRNVIREFFPTIQPRLLVELGILSENEAKEKIKDGLEEIFGERYFIDGTPEEKYEKQQFLEGVYRRGEYIEVPTGDYLDNDAFVSKLLAQSTKENTPLVKAIEDAVKDAYTERTLAEFDLVGMKIDPDMQGNWHTSFLDNLGTLKNKDSPKVKNHQNLQKGAYIRVIQDRNGEKSYGYFRIVDIDKEFSMPVEKMRDADGLPVKHRGIRFEDWGAGSTDSMLTPGHERIDEKTYSQLWSLLKDPNTQSEILTEEEIQERRTTEYMGEDRIQTHYSETDAYDSLDTLSDALGWKPQVGGVYSTQEVEGGADFFIEIMDIVDTGISKKIIVSDGKETHSLSFSDFYNKLALPLKLKEKGKYATNDDINKLIQELDGFKEVFIKDGVLMQSVKGVDGKTIEIPIHHFMNEDGEGMYFDGIASNGAMAGFGTVKGKAKKKKEEQDWTDMKGKVNLKAFTGNSRQVSIVGILNYLTENDYKPYINPKDKPEHDHEAHMPHSHGSIWGKILNNMSFSDMGKAFDLYKHAWEHKLEKNSKFQSAKFADKYLRNLMPEGFSYQLRSEAYSAQNEAMEGILKMLENDMSGKEARLYIRTKILLNDDAKFEEVLAGLLYISKKSGQLYPEELSDLKNSQLWFYKLAVTQGYTSKSSRDVLRAKCIQSSDKGADSLDAITEIDLVERQLKFYEGKGHRLPPNIAPKFPGAIAEGKDESSKKGDTEVNLRSNIKQMNKYALSKGYVGEWYKVLGTMDRIHSKNGSPTELNVMPFTMLMSNAPEYMGSAFRKALHSEGTGPRASHAFKFGNEMSLVNTYRSAVGIAVSEVARRTGKVSIINEFDAIEKERKNVGNQNHDTDTEDVQKKWIISIFDFWMKHGKELQPILQMSDPYFTAEAEFGKNDDKKRVCAAYKKRWIGTSAMQNGQVEKIYDNQNVTEGNMTPDHTPFAFTNMMNGVASAISSHDAQLSVRGKDSAWGKLFKDGILGALNQLRNLDERNVPEGMNKRDIQKLIFREYYAAIIFYLRTKGPKPPEKMIGGNIMGTLATPANYIEALWKQGIDIRKEDFRNSETTPAGLSGDEKTDDTNPLFLDVDDEKRCNEMFETFINKPTTRSIVRNTRKNVNWDEMGG